MRIEAQGQAVETVTSTKSMNTNSNKVIEKQNQDDEQLITKEKLHQAVDSINEIFEINNKNLKFVYHEGLKQYFVQLVDTNTEEVVREIPPKKLLDAFYEMQKLVGMIVDEKR
ncbi:flagellar protein FlaG [Lysinibacillus endophyticus]|uniref:flagellar protein FlaG n=1 Tax=Ureibacillus endophyticus TaxID=1978490 RepID=UPI003135028F